jgi:hypothetical protein
MFRTFRNFPRITNKSNVVEEPQTVVYVADGIVDTSTGAWISPSRTVTTDDGTFRIGLMNPFAGAAVTNATTTGNGTPCFWNPATGQLQSDACIAICDVCDCEAERVATNRKSSIQYTNADCRVVNVSEVDGTCFMDCLLSRSGPIASELVVSCSGQGEYNCDPNSGQIEIPPHETSTIIRAIERFILDLDITQIKDVDPNSINSAILRLPIKNKSDWM